MIQEGYIYIASAIAIVAGLLMMTFGVRYTLKRYRKESDGKISSIKEVLKYEKELGKEIGKSIRQDG